VVSKGMLRVIVVFVLLLFDACIAAPTGLTVAQTAISNLYLRIDGLSPGDNKQQVNAGNTVVQLAILSNAIPTIATADFNTFLNYKPNAQVAAGNLVIFQLIMKLLYVQSLGQKGDFGAFGGPNIRLYAFAVLGKILGSPNMSPMLKTYVRPYLQPDSPQGIYDFTAQYNPPGPNSPDQDRIQDDPLPPDYWQPPLFDAFDTIAAQLNNFYRQWSNIPILYGTTKLSIVDSALFNMLVVIDFICSVDDEVTFPPPPATDPADNYIFFFETNGVLDTLISIASIDTSQSSATKKNIVVYANFLLATYFIPPLVGDPVPVLPTNRLVVQAPTYSGTTAAGIIFKL
jgi:hypothetical protein